MFEIRNFAVENLTAGCVTDVSRPKFTFYVVSDGKDVSIAKAELKVGDWKTDAVDQTATRYDGPALKPCTVYEAKLCVTASTGETAKAELKFETGKLSDPWKGAWISDPTYVFKEKKVSPVPMTFRKKLSLTGAVKSAKLYATALGIYELAIDGTKVGDRYFAPGFTSYKSQLMYQVYDVTDQVADGSVLTAVVAGGWAVGSFVFTRVNRHNGDRQAFLAELHVEYEDGSKAVIGTDDTWEVTEDGNVRMADLYDGETYDATISLDRISWKKAARESLRISPKLLADYGSPVKTHEEMKPVSVNPVGKTWIYDFGQNFAGVVRMKIKNAKAGQVITVRHAEILNPDGTLNVFFLRSAKATAQYICREGEQEYMPTLTYMGFRYASVEGIAPEDIELTGVAMYSDLSTIGDFHCSNEMINQLQHNIIWGAKSNLFDIPTDCPQRDERMGWTGDIAVFSPTACFNFDMSRFLNKWLIDVQSEQLPTGGIPNTVPVQGYGFPATMPEMAIDWWGDACVLVPWAEYMARGDKEILRRFFPMMKKYIKACKFWAGLFSFGKNRYIWNTPATLHFGDWVAPDVPKMSQWQGRAKWTATASLHNTSALAAKIAEILGETADAAYYKDLSEKVADAYVSVFTDGNGKLANEFQTGYVLPIHMNMFPTAEIQKKATQNLANLVKRGDYCIGTGFPGTPYILFTLADNGEEETAFKMLTNTKCPSWLYEVKVGATTIWERWDGLDENGVCPIGNDGTDAMISYNHYASGAVGDFLYRRVAGIEPTSPGYRTFAVKPLIGGGITSACAKTLTPYGKIVSDWSCENGQAKIHVEVPVGTTCTITWNGKECTLGSGVYDL